MMEASRISETSVENYFTRQYIPEDKSELHTRRRDNLKSHLNKLVESCYVITIECVYYHTITLKLPLIVYLHTGEALHYVIYRVITNVVSDNKTLSVRK
jgi:hypothetical protein